MSVIVWSSIDSSKKENTILMSYIDQTYLVMSRLKMLGMIG